MSAGYREEPVLKPLDLDLPIGRATAVLGPGGSGKTTLLRALACAPYPETMWVSGDRGRDLDPLLWVAQKPRHETSREALELLDSPQPGATILLDEPFVNVPEDEHELLHGRLAAVGPECTVLCVSHNLRHARRFCDHAVLLVAGELIESAPADDFFNRPRHPRTSDFLVTGS
ncbi:MAG: ATP-binding cassette domain-containing protein [Acidobacteriota bacterium]